MVDVRLAAESTRRKLSSLLRWRKRSEWVNSIPRHANIFCSLKRQAQQKKRKERERKELEALGRRHFANVRVVQRNVVYVVGLGPRFAKEEVCKCSNP